LSDKASQNPELKAEIDELRNEVTNNILDLSIKSPFFAADENWSGKPVGENIAVKVNQRIGTICFDKYGNLGFIAQHYHLGSAGLIVISSGWPASMDEASMRREIEIILKGKHTIAVKNGTADKPAAYLGEIVTLTAEYGKEAIPPDIDDNVSEWEVEEL
jgi:hypothetical protein